MAPFALEPKLSAVGSEQLRLRLQKWQAEQDLQRSYKTHRRLQQRNIELREQLDCMYEDEQMHEYHHLKQMEHLYRTSIAGPGQEASVPISGVTMDTVFIHHAQQQPVSTSLPGQVAPVPISGASVSQVFTHHGLQDQPVLSSFATAAPSISPVVLHRPSPDISPSLPHPSNSGTTNQMQHLSEVPMVVLPIFPDPGHFQHYDQYLYAHEYWVRWHQVTAPDSLNMFNIYQVTN